MGFAILIATSSCSNRALTRRVTKKGDAPNYIIDGNYNLRYHTTCLLNTCSGNTIVRRKLLTEHFVTVASLNLLLIEKNTCPWYLEYSHKITRTHLCQRPLYAVETEESVRCPKGAGCVNRCLH